MALRINKPQTMTKEWKEWAENVTKQISELNLKTEENKSDIYRLKEKVDMLMDDCEYRVGSIVKLKDEPDSPAYHVVASTYNRHYPTGKRWTLTIYDPNSQILKHVKDDIVYPAPRTTSR